nr:hypothetical protein [Tanacetum cinerariifolium]
MEHNTLTLLTTKVHDLCLLPFQTNPRRISGSSSTAKLSGEKGLLGNLNLVGSHFGYFREGDTSRNNQSRQQPPKRQDVARAYAAGS